MAEHTTRYVTRRTFPSALDGRPLVQLGLRHADGSAVFDPHQPQEAVLAQIEANYHLLRRLFALEEEHADGDAMEGDILVEPERLPEWARTDGRQLLVWRTHREEPRPFLGPDEASLDLTDWRRGPDNPLWCGACGSWSYNDPADHLCTPWNYDAPCESCGEPTLVSTLGAPGYGTVRVCRAGHRFELTPCGVYEPWEVQ